MKQVPSAVIIVGSEKLHLLRSKCEWEREGWEIGKYLSFPCILRASRPINLSRVAAKWSGQLFMALSRGIPFIYTCTRRRNCGTWNGSIAFARVAINFYRLFEVVTWPTCITQICLSFEVSYLQLHSLHDKQEGSFGYSSKVLSSKWASVWASLRNSVDWWQVLVEQIKQSQKKTCRLQITLLPCVLKETEMRRNRK